MVELISRSLAFKQCPQLAKQIMDHQQVMFNPEEEVYAEGEAVYLELDDDQPTVLTKEKANELNSEHAEHCMSVCDEFEEIPPQSAWVERIIAELNAPTFESFVEDIGQSLVELSLALGWGELIAIGERKAPYLAQENSYKPVRKAVHRLLSMGIDRKTHDGIILRQSDCAEFFASMFWIVRCNASAPGICFSSPNSNIVGKLCKHRNIHFESYDQAESDILRTALRTAGFRELSNGVCAENFSSSEAIDGRSIVMK